MSTVLNASSQREIEERHIVTLVLESKERIVNSFTGPLTIRALGNQCRLERMGVITQGEMVEYYPHISGVP